MPDAAADLRLRLLRRKAPQRPRAGRAAGATRSRQSREMPMNRLIIAAGLAAALAMPAYAQGKKTHTMAKKAPTTSEFVKKAAMTNMFEIEAGKVAQNKSQNAKVGDYAKMIEQDHQKAQDELQSKMQGMQNAKLPAKLDSKHQKMVDSLKSASGAKFLRTFKTQQVKGHQEAVQLFQGYAQGGDKADLKQWAQTSVPMLQKHLQEAQQLPTSAGSAPTVGAGSTAK
jgi:putative membrane protein